MTKEQLIVIRELRDSGYAIVLVTPDELKGANPDKLEDELISLSWGIIDSLDKEVE